MTSIKSVFPLGFPWKTQDPFLFCVHHFDKYPRGNERLGPAASLDGRNLGQDFSPNKEGWRMYHGEQVPGFPAHPHYGFETITIVTNGVVDHSDSLGAAGRFGFGDVQWMTAGHGVQHCEMFPLLSREHNNPLELFQIWLNLPGNKKGASPYFAMLWNDTIPIYTCKDTNDKTTEVKIIAGAIDGLKAPAPAPDSWAADREKYVAVWLIKMESGAKWTIPASSPGVNRSVFFYNGSSVNVEGKEYSASTGFEIVSDAEVELIGGEAESYFLLLQGKPINEPVVQQGPFVVNSAEEFQQVMSNYRRTQFGGWPWPSFEHVHARERTRFALYPNGKEEQRPL